MKRFALLLFAAFILAAFHRAAVADTALPDDDKNHQHHEDLTASQLGTVVFPSLLRASVQKPFERGIALLHSFWYEEAEKEFMKISTDDPTAPWLIGA